MKNNILFNIFSIFVLLILVINIIKLRKYQKENFTDVQLIDLNEGEQGDIGKKGSRGFLGQRGNPGISKKAILNLKGPLKLGSTNNLYIPEENNSITQLNISNRNINTKLKIPKMTDNDKYYYLFMNDKYNTTDLYLNNKELKLFGDFTIKGSLNINNEDNQNEIRNIPKDLIPEGTIFPYYNNIRDITNGIYKITYNQMALKKNASNDILESVPYNGNINYNLEEFDRFHIVQIDKDSNKYIIKNVYVTNAENNIYHEKYVCVDENNNIKLQNNYDDSCEFKLEIINNYPETTSSNNLTNYSHKIYNIKSDKYLNNNLSLVDTDATLFKLKLCIPFGWKHYDLNNNKYIKQDNSSKIGDSVNNPNPTINLSSGNISNHTHTINSHEHTHNYKRVGILNSSEVRTVSIKTVSEDTNKRIPCCSIYNNYIYVLDINNKIFKKNINGMDNWEQINESTHNTVLRQILVGNNKIYAIHADQKIYTSPITNSVNWTNLDDNTVYTIYLNDITLYSIATNNAIWKRENENFVAQHLTGSANQMVVWKSNNNIYYIGTDWKLHRLTPNPNQSHDKFLDLKFFSISIEGDFLYGCLKTVDYGNPKEHCILRIDLRHYEKGTFDINKNISGQDQSSGFLYYIHSLSGIYVEISNVYGIGLSIIKSWTTPNFINNTYLNISNIYVSNNVIYALGYNELNTVANETNRQKQIYTFDMNTPSSSLWEKFGYANFEYKTAGNPISQHRNLNNYPETTSSNRNINIDLPYLKLLHIEKINSY